MTKVAVKKCESYDPILINKALDDLLLILGGWERYIKPDQTVLLKTNLLMGKSPEKAVTTNPEILRAVGRKVKTLGAEVLIADSPGGPFNRKILKRAYQKSGILAMAAEENFNLNYNVNSHQVEFAAGKITKKFQLADYLEEADLIINLPKLKTHGLTMYTGAVKNLFGCIPGILKAEYHLRLQSVYDFSRMLNDLACLLKPELTIMDAIVGMEGDGPSNGSPRYFNYLLASTSPFLLDLAAADKLMGIEPPTLVPSIAAALADQIINEADLEICGEQLVTVKDLAVPKIEKESNLLDQRLPDFLANFLTDLLRPKPIFKSDSCVGCRTCVLNCPPGAITMENNLPQVNLKQCIRCFCCQELCSYDAVEIKYPLLAKLFFSN